MTDNETKSATKAILQTYDLWGRLNSESECVAELMKMYQKLTGSAD